MNSLTKKLAIILIILLSTFLFFSAAAKYFFPNIALSFLGALKSQFSTEHRENQIGENFTVVAGDYPINVVVIPYPRKQPDRFAIEFLRDKIILINRRGFGHILNLNDDRKVVKDKKIKLNISDFITNNQKLVKNDPSKFGVLDIFYDKKVSTDKLYISSHSKSNIAGCYKISIFSVNIEELLSEKTNINTESRFSTHDCVQLDSNDLTASSSGGRIAGLNGDLLLTTGDHGTDGVLKDGPILAQDWKSDFGKVLLVSTRDWRSRVFSGGHRNSQGLLVTQSGDIFASEHGPQGGDELNHLADGGNFGWPYRTNGVMYDKFYWPLEGSASDNANFVPPFFSWVPSPAVSVLIELDGRTFPKWSGRLFLGTLKNKQVRILKISDDHIELDQPIYLGYRISDAIRTDDYGLILTTDEGYILMLSVNYDFLYQDDIKDLDLAGAVEIIRASGCSNCHSVSQRETQGNFAPDLWGVFGRDVGSSPDFEYSNTLKLVEGVWDEDTLLEFLNRESDKFYGSSMPPTALSKERAKEIVGALRKLQ